MTSYDPGVPCWVDLSTPDQEAAKAFYGGLFGWDAETDPDPQYGGYTNFLKGGRSVAGMMTLMGEGQPPAWSSYISVADADAAAAAVQAAGGKALMEPMDVGTLGRMGMFFDPADAAFGVWQPVDFPGAVLVNEPDTFCWSGLLTRDLDAARRFYTGVFGYQTRESEFGGSLYVELLLEDGRSVAGMSEMGEQWPAEVPPHWGVSFAVADCDAAADRARELGGTVTAPAMDTSVGRLAMLADPHGAAFTVIALAGG